MMTHHIAMNTMKFFVISALVAAWVAEEAMVMTTPLAYAGYPYAGLGFAGYQSQKIFDFLGGI